MYNISVFVSFRLLRFLKRSKRFDKAVLNDPVNILYTTGFTHDAANDNVCDNSFAIFIAGTNGKLASSKKNHELIICVGSQHTPHNVVTNTTSLVALERKRFFFNSRVARINSFGFCCIFSWKSHFCIQFFVLERCPVPILLVVLVL
uniref:Sema domain-containing protein n=1 Tax=Schistosoma curassoni TaxID=6186 RepID=A0A183KHE3_9TREM